MATVYSLVCENGSAGTYWANLSAADRLRYGAVGSERVFASLFSWLFSRQASTTPLNIEVCEIGDAFTDIVTTTMSFNLDCAAVYVTPTINGVFSSAWHGGVWGAGYKLYLNRSFGIGIDLLLYDNHILDISLYSNSTSCQLIRTAGQLNSVQRCFLTGSGTESSQTGINATSSANMIFRNVISNLRIGLVPAGYTAHGNRVINNLITKCDEGVRTATSASGTYFNNISIGNITNWGAAINSVAAGYNMGETGDSPWYTGIDTSIIVGSTSIFVDFANNDFRPASALSEQVNAAREVVGVSLVDIANNPVPNYEPATFPNNHWDIGPFEYDHGNGLAPKQVTISISGMAEGSALFIYKTSDGSAIVPPTTIGASGSHSITYSYTGDTQIEIRVRKGTEAPFYLPYKAPGLITDTGFALIVSQIPDTVLNNA